MTAFLCAVTGTVLQFEDILVVVACSSVAVMDRQDVTVLQSVLLRGGSASKVSEAKRGALPMDCMGICAPRVSFLR